MYIEHSLMADYFYAGLALLVIASFVAGYIDSIAGGAGLILIPAFMLTGLPPHMALGQEKLVSSVGTLAAISNFIKNKSVYWLSLIHISEPTRQAEISYAVFCLKKKKKKHNKQKKKKKI